jgi:hypothetical protein
VALPASSAQVSCASAASEGASEQERRLVATQELVAPERPVRERLGDVERATRRTAVAAQ